MEWIHPKPLKECQLCCLGPETRLTTWEEQAQAFDPTEEAPALTLVAAVEAKNLNLVKDLVKAGADVNGLQRPAVGTTLNSGKIKIISSEHNGNDFYYTIHVRHDEATTEATSTAKPIGEPGEDGHYGWFQDYSDLVRTPLQTAADNCALEIVAYLLEQEEIEVDTEPYYEYGRTALQAAIESGHPAIVERILAHGAKVYETPDLPEHRSNVMQFACSLSGEDVRKKIMDLLIYPTDAGGVARERSGFYEFMSSLLGGGGMKKAECFKLILEQLPDEEEIMTRKDSKLAHTLLHRAAWSCRAKRKADDQPGLCGFLIDILMRPKLIKHAATGLQKYGQRTALHLAAASNDEEAVRKLINEGTCHLNKSDNHRSTPLSLAVENEHAKVTKVLLHAGATTTSIPYANLRALLKGAYWPNPEDSEHTWEPEYKAQPTDDDWQKRPSIVRIRGYRPFPNSKDQKNKAFTGKTEIEAFLNSSECHFGPDSETGLDWLKPSLLFLFNPQALDSDQDSATPGSVKGSERENGFGLQQEPILQMDSFVKPDHFLLGAGYDDNAASAGKARSQKPNFVRWSTIHIHNLREWRTAFPVPAIGGPKGGDSETAPGLAKQEQISTDENTGAIIVAHACFQFAPPDSDASAMDSEHETDFPHFCYWKETVEISWLMRTFPTIDEISSSKRMPGGSTHQRRGSQAIPDGENITGLERLKATAGTERGPDAHVAPPSTVEGNSPVEAAPTSAPPGQPPATATTPDAGRSTTQRRKGVSFAAAEPEKLGPQTGWAHEKVPDSPQIRASPTFAGDTESIKTKGSRVASGRAEKKNTISADQVLEPEQMEFRLWSFHFRVRSTYPLANDLTIPRNAVEFVSYLVDILNKKWDAVIDAANEHLLEVRQVQLRNESIDSDLVDCLLKDAREWITLKKDLQAHIDKMWELHRKFESEKILQSELSAPRKSSTNAPKTKVTPSTFSGTVDKSAASSKQTDDVKVTIPKPINALKAKIQDFSDKKRKALGEVRMETREMIELEFNLVSIKEARASIKEAGRSYAVSVSMKRLSWITFIFLPLMFIATMFGMNVDILADNPSWKLYAWIAVPTLSAIFLGTWVWDQYFDKDKNSLMIKQKRKKTRAQKALTRVNVAAAALVPNGASHPRQVGMADTAHHRFNQFKDTIRSRGDNNHQKERSDGSRASSPSPSTQVSRKGEKQESKTAQSVVDQEFIAGNSNGSRGSPLRSIMMRHFKGRGQESGLGSGMV